MAETGNRPPGREAASGREAWCFQPVGLSSTWGNFPQSHGPLHREKLLGSAGISHPVTRSRTTVFSFWDPLSQVEPVARKRPVNNPEQ